MNVKSSQIESNHPLYLLPIRGDWSKWFFFRILFFVDTYTFDIYIRVIWKKVFPEFVCLHWLSYLALILRKALSKIKFVIQKYIFIAFQSLFRLLCLKESVQLFFEYKYSIFLALKHITIRRDRVRIKSRSGTTKTSHTLYNLNLKILIITIQIHFFPETQFFLKHNHSTLQIKDAQNNYISISDFLHHGCEFVFWIVHSG